MFIILCLRSKFVDHLPITSLKGKAKKGIRRGLYARIADHFLWEYCEQGRISMIVQAMFIGLDMFRTKWKFI